MATASSRRFEDLKDELISLKEKIRINLRRKANEITINKLFIDGDRLIEMIRAEVGKCPAPFQPEMNIRFHSLQNEWTAFKTTTKSSSGNKYRGGFIPSTDQSSSSSSTTTQYGQVPIAHRQILAQGIESLERTSQSLNRAQMVARESEEIGTNIIDELGNQRESLLRTRETLDATNSNLKRSHRLIRSINTTLMTNKCLLIVIIILEIIIFSVIVFFRFIMKHK